MKRATVLFALAVATSLALTAGCTTLGGHVAGEFACRAPKGDCAPTQVIDARATGASSDLATTTAALDNRAWTRAEPGDLARTRERTLRIVFPAHVDGAGVFHDEAVAWAIAEPADWAARARSIPGDASPRAIGRAIGRAIARRLKATDEQGDDADVSGSDDLLASTATDRDMQLVSPPVLPSTAREAIAGAHAPAIEGFDVQSPGARIPRSPQSPRSLVGDPALVYPSIEAIEGARRRASATARPLIGPVDPEVVQPSDADAVAEAAPTEPRP